MGALEHFEFGFVEGHIGDMLGENDCPLKDFGVAVIHCLDSSPDSSVILRVAKKHGLRATIEFNNVVVPALDLRRAAREGVFVGFDELWILDSRHLSEEIPRNMRITSNSGPRFEHGIPAELLEKMRRTGCRVLLGDGCGVNYAADHEDFVEFIRKTAT